MAQAMETLDIGHVRRDRGHRPCTKGQGTSAMFEGTLDIGHVRRDRGHRPCTKGQGTLARRWRDIDHSWKDIDPVCEGGEGSVEGYRTCRGRGNGAIGHAREGAGTVRRGVRPLSMPGGVAPQRSLDYRRACLESLSIPLS